MISTKLKVRARLKVRCEADRFPTKKAPDVRVPRTPPPPPVIPPPPPPEEEYTVPDGKLFGFNRRVAIPLMIGVPLGVIWGGYLRSQRIEEEVVASVFIPKKTRKGVMNFRRDVKLVRGKNKMVYVVGEDERGRKYMVDANGTLFYDSGISDVGWYAVSTEGDVWNIYAENDEIKVKSVGDISEMTPFQFDEFMGLPTEARRWVAFRDREIKKLPPDIPLVKSSRDNLSYIPPFFVDEGQMVLEEKHNLNPFKKKDGGGKFKLDR